MSVIELGERRERKRAQAELEEEDMRLAWEEEIVQLKLDVRRGTLADMSEQISEAGLEDAGELVTCGLRVLSWLEIVDSQGQIEFISTKVSGVGWRSLKVRIYLKSFLMLLIRLLGFDVSTYVNLKEVKRRDGKERRL